MDTKEFAIRYFISLKGKKRRINNLEFENCLNILKREANNGFEEEEVASLIDALVYIEGLSCNKFRELLKWIVPHQKVAADSALKLLRWVFTYHSSVPSGNVVAALEWIICLLEFGLTVKESVHAYYHHFYELLHKTTEAKYACKLIHLLTKPSDVLRWIVKRVLEVEKKYGRKDHTTALLVLFKSLKPECVPEKVPAISLQFAFKHIGKMNAYFERACQRLEEQDREDHKRKIVWNVDEGKKKLKMETAVKTIPQVDYINFESERYRAKTLHSVLEFEMITSLGSHCHELEIPCNVMSLLQNEAGIHVIATSDKNLQTRFSYNLYYTLYRAFIEQEKGYIYNEKKKLLNQIVVLEEYMQQGIPVVSRFLAEYLCTWDAEDFREVIFSMLQWVTFSSYTELHDLVLSHIHTIFVSGSIEVKCSVIAMLNKFVQNMIIFRVSQRSENVADTFLRSKGDKVEIETLQCIVEFVMRLCVLGLTVERENYLLMDEILNFFEMMTFLENRYRLPMWTVMPPMVVYSGLITRSALMLSRVCSILLKYEIVYPYFKKKNLRREFTYQINLQNMYLVDFINCLREGKCFENKESYLFKDVPDEHLKRLSKYVVPNEALILTHHIALLPYIAKAQEGSHVLLNITFDFEDMEIITSGYLESIYELVQLRKLRK